MKTSNWDLVLIPSKRQREWRERLCNSNLNRTCAGQDCIQWDSGYNSAVEEPLNGRREKDQENYFLWMEQFCNHLGPEVEESLIVLQRKGGCMPCIGRMIYQYLCVEFFSQYLFHNKDIESLRESPEFPDNLPKVQGRAERVQRDALMRWITGQVVQVVVSQCNHPNYDHLAVLLNHGCSFPVHLLGGSFGAYRFQLLEVEYNGPMLRARADGADPFGTFDSMTKNLSPEELEALLKWMRSKKK